MSVTVNSIRERVLNGELLTGTFLNLGSSVTVEMSGDSGFDWILIDLEHGPSDQDSLLYLLQAASATPASPIVRIAFNETVRFKKALDLGAAGIMVPWIRNAEEAKEAVAAMRYPPLGIRGVAKSPRATGFSYSFDDYFERNHELLLTVIQIERTEALEEIDQIASIHGVDVLFIGPMDLSVSLGHPGDFQHPDQQEAYRKVIAAANEHGKSAGILLQSIEQIEPTIELGFKFVAIGSDSALVGRGMRELASAFDRFKT